MRIAFILYQGLNLTEFALMYDPITRIRTMGFDPGLSWDCLSYTLSGDDDRGLQIIPSKVGGLLSDYDVIVVPGGDGALRLAKDEGFVYWLSNGAQVPVRCASGSGILLAGMSGMLLGSRVAAPPSPHEQLKTVCRELHDAPFVQDHNCLTCRGGITALELSRHLVDLLQGREVRSEIFSRMSAKTGDDPAPLMDGRVVNRSYT